MSNTYDICIIGGGQSGLVTCKTFIESGKSFILLEKCKDGIGMFSTIKEKRLFKWSTSRYMSGFSDFPMPKELPVWFTIEDYVNYLETYKKHFGLNKFVQYNSEVKKCYQNEKEEWIVEYNNTNILCKKLIVCAGLNQTPKFPEIIKVFTGEVIHTEHIYRNMYKTDWQNKFTGKKILLLGGAESAYDIGHVLVQYTDQLYYSTKNYTEWFPKGDEEPEIKKRINKISEYNKCIRNISPSNDKQTAFNNPTDTQLTYIEYSLPEPMSHVWHEYGRSILSNILNFNCGKCTHQNTELCLYTKTPNNLFKKYVVKRTEFILDIYEKKVHLGFYPDKIEGTTAYTKNEIIENIDIIVCGTGFKKVFPFLKEDMWNGGLIKKMIPIKYNNLAFIGYARPTMGSIASVAEMQSWWLEKYFYDPTFSYRIRTPWFRRINPLDLENDHINTVVIGCFYIKDLAKDLRIEPNMLWLLFTDFELFSRIYTGSCHPMMYRIHGYKSYMNSRNVLLDTYLDTKKKYIMEYVYILFFLLFHIVFIVFLICIAFIFSFIVYSSKKMKKYVKYKEKLFIGLSIMFIFIFYRYF